MPLSVLYYCKVGICMGNKGLIFVLLLFLGIGFASLSVTLYINGGIHIKPDSSGFEQDVKFSSVTVDAISSNSGTSAAISSDGKSINFSTHPLKSIGERVTISYDIINNSGYIARIGQLTCTPLTDGSETYISIQTLNRNRNLQLAKGSTSGKDEIVIQMVRSYGADDNRVFNYTCSLGVNAISG